MAGKLTELKVVLSAEDKASAAIQHVGNGVRQLGDNSAGAARGFGAMQKGLGGFVGAYAGAAATFFALQQGFSALKEAAKMEQSIEGTKLLASEIGDSGTRILESIKNITKGQLTLKDSAEATNLALSSGFNGDQIEKLTSIATKASFALGRDLGDSFIRLVRGSAKLEPELLDELGIFTRIEPAVQAYAISMGKSEKFLTNFERRQAFVNAVTEEGSRKFSNISASGTSTAASLERLATTMYDLGQKITNVLATSFAPFADFLSGSLANSFSAIGIVGGLAFTKLFQLISEGLTNTTKKLTDFNDSLQSSLKKYTNVRPEVSKALQEAAGNYDIKGKGAPAKAGEFIERLRKEGFKASDVTSLQTELLKARAKSQAEIADVLSRSKIDPKAVQQGLGTMSGLNAKDTKDYLNFNFGMATSTRGSTPGTLQQKELDSLTRVVQQGAPNAAMLDSIQKYLDAQSKAAKGTEGLIIGMQKFSVAAVNAFSFITSAISKTLFWVSIIQLGISLFSQIFGGSSAFDVFYKKIGDMTLAFLGMTQSAQETKKAVSSLASITLGEEFKKRNIEPTTKFNFIESLGYESPKDMSDLTKEIDATLKKALDATKPVIIDGIEFNEGESFSKSMDEAITALGKIRPASYDAAEALQAQIAAMKNLRDNAADVVEIMAQLSISTGVTAQALKEAGMLSKNVFEIDEKKTKTTYKYNDDGLSLDIFTNTEREKLREQERKRISDINISSYRTPGINFLGANLFSRTVNTKMSPDLASREANKTIDIANKVDKISELNVALDVALKSTNKYINEQVINADALAKQEVAIQTQIDKLEELQDQLKNIDEMSKDSPLLQIYNKIFGVNKEITEENLKQANITKDKLGSIQGLLQLENQLAKTFQNEINLSQQFSGSVNSKGKLATQTYELRANALTNLGKLVANSPEEDLDTSKLSKAERKRLLSKQSIGEEGVLLRLDATSKNIIKGLRVSVAQEIENLGNASIKTTAQTELELVTSIVNLRKQNNADELQASESKLQMLNAQYEAQSKLLASVIRLKEVEESIAQIGYKTVQTKLTAAKTSITAKQQLQPVDELAVSSVAIKEIDQKIIAENKKSLESAQALQQIKFTADTQDTAKKLALLKTEQSENEKNAKIKIENIELEKNLLLSKIDADLKIKDMEYDILDKRVDILVQEGEMLSKFAVTLSKTIARDVATAEIALPKGQQSEQTTKALEGFKGTREQQVTKVANAYVDNIRNELFNLGKQAQGVKTQTSDSRARIQLAAEKTKQLAEAVAEAQIKKTSNDLTIASIKSQSEAQSLLAKKEEEALNSKKIAMEQQLEMQNKIVELGQIEVDLAVKLLNLTQEHDAATLQLINVNSARIIQDAENKIAVMRADEEHANAMRDIAVQTAQLQARAASTAIQGQINRLNAAKEQLDITMQIGDAEDRLANSRREAADLIKNDRLQLKSDIANDVGSNLYTDQQKREIKLELDISKLDTLQESTDRAIKAADRNAEIKNQQLEIEKDIAKKQYDLAVAQAGADAIRIQAEIQKITDQNKILDEEKKQKKIIFDEQKNMLQFERDNQLKKVEEAKRIRELELSATDSRVNLLVGEITNLAGVLDNFVLNLAGVLSQEISILTSMYPENAPEKYRAGLIDTKTHEATKEQIAKDVKVNLTKDIKPYDISQLGTTAANIKSNIASNRIMNDLVAEKQTSVITTEYNKKADALNNEIVAYEKSIANIKEKNSSLLKNLELEQKTAGADLANAKKVYEDTISNIDKKKKLNEIINEGDKQDLVNKSEAYRLEVERSRQLAELANSPFFKAANDFVGIVKDDMTKGLLDLNEALVTGTLTMSNFTEGLRDWAYSLIKDIQKSLVTRTIVEPITNFLQKGLGDMLKDAFGIGGEKNPNIDPVTGKEKTIASAMAPNGGVNVNIISDQTKVASAANPTGTPGITTAERTKFEEENPALTTAAGYNNNPDTEGLQSQADAAQTAIKSTSSTFGEFTSSFGNYGVALAGSFASILASGGDFKTSLVGIFASLFAQIAKNIATSGSLTGVAGGAGSETIGGIGSWLGSLFSGGASAGGGAAASSLASFAPVFVSSGGSIQAFNSGGEVQKHLESVIGLASGGRSGRDSVPAMLEPGEFVIRKSAAQALGVNKLNDLNNHGDNASWLNNTRPANISAPIAPMIMPMPVATPATSAPPNVSVNVTNTGTQQEVQGKPNVRMNGQQMVIDIITRDFANNGPIRQSMRGNNF
jgi:hypothetical protein